MSARKQCKACPWRKDVVPGRDIPGGYCAAKHAALDETIAEPGDMRFGGSLRLMACHETPAGREQPCVGWLVHQLGPGNNIGLRLAAMSGRFGKVETVGEQHETFEATLGSAKKRRKASKR